MAVSGKTSTEAWLETVAAQATAAGCDSPSQTIDPRRAQRDAEALLGELSRQQGVDLVLGEVLGSGGMATIWLGRQSRLDREVAVKSLRDPAPPEVAVELVREARVTGSLEHPNIVPIHDIVTDRDGRPQVVMKRIVGTTWAELLADRERLDLVRLRADVEILIQVANAVRFAHARGIVHRDLKPANVMIGPFGEVYVVDWGLASAPGVVSVMAGTPAYMAPEMLGGDGAVVDERSDVYLLGGVLLEVATGQVPHPGRTLMEALDHVRAGEVAIPAAVPAELAAVCRRALARDPGDRQQSVDQLVGELRAFLDHLSSASLSTEALRSLDQLRELLGRDDPERDRVYNLFGECRFGFRAALAAWADNREARDGLGRALEALTEHELSRGDEGAAAALLAEHPDPPADLRARVDQAAGARADRERRLEKLEADFDPEAGRGPRLVATVLTTLLWVVFPVVLALADLESTVSRDTFHEIAIVICGGWTVILFGIIQMAVWPALEPTRFNRVVVWGTWLGALGTAGVMVIARSLDLPVVSTPILALLLWAVVAAVIAVAFEWRIAICAGGFAIGALVSAVDVDLRWWMMAAANVIVALTAILAWGREDRRGDR